MQHPQLLYQWQNNKKKKKNDNNNNNNKRHATLSAPAPTAEGCQHHCIREKRKEKKRKEKKRKKRKYYVTYAVAWYMGTSV
jgi:hypothetical protein